MLHLDLKAHSTLATTIRMPLNIWYEPTVLSDCNLSGFLSWTRKAHKGQVLAALDRVCIVQHRSLLPPPPVTIQIGDMSYDIPQAECVSPLCERCFSLRGGYQFRFVSPLWTEMWWIPMWWNPFMSRPITGPEMRERMALADPEERTNGSMHIEGYAGDR